MKRTFFLHIGTEKTGTTSIQSFLSENRSRLEEQGIFYPRSPGNHNHTALTVYALRKTKQGSIRRSSGVFDPEQVTIFRDRFVEALDKELGTSTLPTVVFSNEHLSSRLSEDSEVARIKKLCDTYAGRTKIIVYLRNQVDFLVSSFGTGIKSGSTRRFPFPLTKRRLGTMDYCELLDRWQKAFGRENMIVRRFAPAHFVDGDLFSDFAAQIPFDASGFTRSEPRNEGLGARELAFLREFNARVPRWIDGKVLNPEHANIVKAVAKLRGESPRLTVSREIATAIMQQFEDSNRRIAAEYFGSSEPLFSPAQLVSEADVHELLELKSSDAMDIACRLWSEQERKLQELEVPRKNRRSLLMEPDEDPAGVEEQDDD